MPTENNIDDEMDNEMLNNLYIHAKNNIDIIKEKYYDILDPYHNNTTSRYISEGFSLDESISLSFITTFLLLVQINK